MNMPKYIVDGPEANQGEKLSSGGVRKNGKMIEQFKNPVLYKEPEQQVIDVENQNTRTSFAEAHPIFAFIANEIGDVVLEVWYLELKPYLKIVINEKIHNYLETKLNKREIKSIKLHEEQYGEMIQKSKAKAKITQFPKAV